MTDFPILTVLLLLPIIGALIILPIKGEEETGKRNIRQVALLTTVATFILSLVMLANFENAGIREHRQREPQEPIPAHFQ